MTREKMTKWMRVEMYNNALASVVCDLDAMQQQLSYEIRGSHMYEQTRAKIKALQTEMKSLKTLTGRK